MAGDLPRYWHRFSDRVGRGIRVRISRKLVDYRNGGVASVQRSLVIVHYVDNVGCSDHNND